MDIGPAYINVILTDIKNGIYYNTALMKLSKLKFVQACDWVIGNVCSRLLEVNIENINMKSISIYLKQL